MTQQAKTKRDIFPTLAITAGIVAGGVGLYLYMKKPPGVSPGEAINAGFSFDYVDSGGTYVLQVYFIRYDFLGFTYKRIWGRSEQIELPGPGSYGFDLIIPTPLGIPPDIYGAEALIRTPWMEEFDYIKRLITNGAIKVRE